MQPQQSLRPTPRRNPRNLLTSLINDIAALPRPSSSLAPGDGNIDSLSCNPLDSLEENGKKLFLTLHVLLPNETLPALDLLERGCVQRFVAKSQQWDRDAAPTTTVSAETAPATKATTPRPEGTQREKHVFAYYVQSASSQRHHYGAGGSRFVRHEPARYYEVRLHAWNCSCPAFAFSAFPAGLQAEGRGTDLVEEERGEGEGGAWDSRDERAMEGQTEGEEVGVEEEGMLLDTEQDVTGTAARSGEMEEATRAWGFGGLERGAHAGMCKHLLACLLGDRCPLFQHFVEEKEVSVEEAAGWAAGWGA